MRCVVTRPLNGRPRYKLNTVVDIDEDFFNAHKKYFRSVEEKKPVVEVDDVDAIKAQLKEKGIEFDNRFGKAKLLELLNSEE